MATGGTIPSGRKQYVYFYNTHGVIEKDKQMYFAPRFGEDYEDSTVCEAFLELFEEVCPPSSAYSEIEISTWSPQDRTLVVKGNIDDFRLVTDEGACLNYFLVKREVTKGEGQQASTATYYYAFFITGVEQIGGSSVKITAEPDDFTNIFFLHNEHILTNLEATNGSYEPFNERMKNCHVNRQHYDRVEYNGYHYILHVDLVNVEPGISLQLGNEISIRFEDQDPKTVTGEIVGYDDSAYDIGDLYLEIETDERVEIGQQQNWSHIYYLDDSYECEYVLSDIRWDKINHIVPANQKIFLNQEDSFRFKYQYRDDRKLFSLDNLFTDSEMSIISSINLFSSLSQDLRKKILKACIQYLVVEMKSQEQIGKLRKHDIQASSTQVVKRIYTNDIEGFNKYCANIFVPFFNIPDVLSKYESAIKSFGFYAKLKDSADFSAELETASNLYDVLNNYSLGDFVYSAYIVNDIAMPDSKILFDLSNNKIIFNCCNTLELETDNELYLTTIDDNGDGDREAYLQYNYQYTSDIQSNYVKDFIVTSTRLKLVLLLSGFNKREIILSVPQDNLVDIKNRYYDPVLEAEPYSFYSLSYLAYEMPFNKNRYYENMTIKLSYFISVNGAIKISYIPKYTVEGKEFRYYNESLIFTIPSSLPIVCDSYESYYYQNKAQMKNQFAVNDYNRGVDLAQHFFISGPNAVGMSAGKGGMRGGGAGAGAGAILETGNQLAQMTDEVVDWTQSNKVIEMNQKAKLADMGAKPDVVKQAGSDVFSDLVTKENRPYLNHYTIDQKSYDTIAKFLERFGYQVNLYDSLHTIDRVGWNFVKLNSFDWNPASQYDIMVEQEDSIKKIFLQGVTLLHDTYYLTAGHNYEVILD